MTSTTRSIDGADVALITSRFDAVTRRMANTLVRTGRSMVLNTGRDFSCCVITAGDELLAMADSLPIHVMAGPDLMARAMKKFHPTLRRGDAFLHNSPYHGNSHAADHSILIPVIDDDGVHRFTVLAKAHQADCGNATPTTYSAEARDLYEEGALFFPAVRVQKDYEDVEDIIRMCQLRMRVPDQWWGDYLALLGSARIGERAVLELGEELGWDTLEAYQGRWLDYSEERMTAEIAELSPGRITVTTRHDAFEAVPEGIPLRVTVEITDDQRIVVDLRDNPDCIPCGLNLSEATSRTAAMLGVFNAVGGTAVPPNAGSFRRIEVLLRENCIVGIPQHPTSCSVATTNLTDRVANATQRAIAELCEGRGLAEVGFSFPASTSVISGKDPRDNDERFINQMLLAWTGGAGGPEADGWLTTGGVGDAGILQRDSIELDELSFPLRVEEQRLLPDTEGAGEHRGSPAARLEFVAVDASITALYLSDGTQTPAAGARGGGAGGAAAQHLRTPDGAERELEISGSLDLQAGETIVSVCCGGGGYGSPLERDPERVRHDVREGYVTPARAREVYGVVLADDGSVDAAATQAARTNHGGAR